jgi:hypothetical protein
VAFYTLLGLPMGRIADRRNRRNLIGLASLTSVSLARLTYRPYRAHYRMMHKDA